MESIAVFVLVMMVLIVAAIVLAVVLAVRNSRKRQERQQQLAQLASSQGWQFVPRDDSYAQRWQGAPFVRRGRATNIAIGRYRDRNFCCFRYFYTVSSYNGTTTQQQPHVFAVFVMALPGPVPEFSVAAEGAFGGRVAEAFGFDRVNLGDPQFDDTFKIKSADEAFARAVLQPAVVDLLKATGPSPWRLTGSDLIAYRSGELQPAAVLGQLNLLCDLLDRMSPAVWPR